MSDIDSIQNVHVANFKGDIAMYWPMENAPMEKVVRNAGNKTLTPEHILIGGGAGEHPALVIYNDAAVLQALIYDSFVEEPESLEGLHPNVVDFFKQKNIVHDKYSYDIQNPLFDAIRGNWRIDTNQWQLKTWFYFVEQLDKDSLLYEDQPERVMIDMLAAFIIEKMPIESLIDKDIRELVILYHKNKAVLKPYTKQAYIDKLLTYFEEPVEGETGGKKYEDGKNRWSYTLKDWLKDNK